MKKIFALLAVVLGVVSCQTEPEGLDVNVGGEVETTICVSLPETTRANSALGAFENVDLGNENDNKTIRYILKIYQLVDGEYVASNDRQVEYSDGKSVVFPVRLVPNRDYRFVVWADYVENKNDVDYHYNTADLTNITLNGEWKPMDETRDAFTGVYCTVAEGKQYSSTSSIYIELKRPFAKLRVITTDMVELGYLGINPTHATVEYATEYRPGFNALESVALPAGTDKKSHSTVFEIAAYADNTNTNKVLFTDYFFAEQDVVKFTLNVYEDAAGQKLIKSNEFFTDIAVRRNYLTTIQGNILTDGNNVTVEVKDAFANGSDWNPKDDKYDVEVWDGKSISAPSQDSENNYIIKTPSELAWLAAAVNGTLETRAVAADSFAGKTFILSQNIDLGNEPWTPIGNSTTSFKGTFDGNGKIITNLVVNGYNSNVGLFGDTRDGEIKNVTIENAKVSGRLNVGVVAGNPYTSKYTNITVKGHVEVDGMAYVGGVGGKNAYADWTNITVEVDETSYVKANSVENGTAYRTYVGGVVGFNGEGGHKFTNITSNIDVKGSTIDVGGLFGIAHYGNQFESCVCTGDVEIYAAEEADQAEQIGGIAGVWHNGGEDVVFTDCTFLGNVTTNVARETVWYDNLVGCPYTTGNGKLIIDGYEMVGNGVGVKNGEYYVFNAEGLRWIAETVNAGNSFDKKTIKLVNNITLNGEWTPIGTKSSHFKGTFDGQGKTIYGMTITEYNGEPQAALFGTVSITPSFKNLTIDAANIVMPANHTGDFYAAGLIGTFYGTVTIENVTVKNSTFVGNNKVAGLLAHDGVSSNLKIDNSHVLNCKISSGNLTDGGNVGGMIGLFQGAANGEYKITNSSVKDSTITGINSSNTGKRANSEFVACVSSKTNQTLVIEDCVVEGNTFTQTIDGSAAVTYVGPFDNKFVGGERNGYEGETLPGVVIINGVKYDNSTPVASWDEFAAEITAGKQNIKLTEDITYDGNYQLQKDVVIDLNGKSMTLPMINIHKNVTIKNGTINGKVYARKNSNIVFDNVKFSGAVSDNLSTEGHLAIQGGCTSLYAKDCLFSPTSVSGSQTKPLSFEGGSSILKFENCEFKSSPYKKQVYLNSLSATGSLEFINCNFNNKTPNIMFAAACPLTNLTMSGTTKLSSVTLETNRAKDAVTAEDLAYLRESLIANNSMSSVRLFYAGGSSEYIR